MDVMQGVGTMNLLWSKNLCAQWMNSHAQKGLMELRVLFSLRNILAYIRVRTGKKG
jgi:hypothetical protein